MPRHVFTVSIIFVIAFDCSISEQKCGKVENCPETKYRSLDGSCNNLKHPEWGMAMTRFRRLLPAEYGDGIRSFRRSKSGKSLPNARKVSETLFPLTVIPDKDYTLAQMQYGQIITHDIAQGGGLNDLFCCTEHLQYLNKTEQAPNCLPIAVPKNDPFYSKYDAKCISFARSLTDRDLNCGKENKPVQQINKVNSFLDLSIIYGNNKKVHDYMRLGTGGLLKTRKYKDQEWPLQDLNPSESCALAKKNDTCYYPSDPRINQHPHLALLHIIFYREHNRIAKSLAEINSHWDDNTLFEEARKINIAQHQHVSYYEWLSLFMNVTTLREDDPVGYVDEYDENVDPGVLSEHNNAAFRIHTQIAGQLHLVEEDRGVEGTLRLSDWYLRPYVLEERNNFELLARGLSTQRSMAADVYHDKEITHHWFRRTSIGYDLRAIDIQRSRDTGVPTYNKARALCNLSVAASFDKLVDIPKHIQEKLARLYETVDDVGLLVGGAVEDVPQGYAIGPTFQCILLIQFGRTRAGDRFWYERSGETGFTLDQLQEIRKASFSRLICDNAKGVKRMQPKGFKKLSSSNQLVDCQFLPSVNLSLWKI
ncbi:hypothetical protein NQ315_011523 [Exocentrus adspersus]|uniref:Peroxidase n=1 Tax=Exocentrus adspersus TaxID=1586481 RepID=A0AAV8VVY1_9CUCU|nr:hypothetical protein NQ315_011523 [Exocentrus adspersus]